MVNFKSLVKQKRAVGASSLLDLFNSLDRHASHIELRPVQEQALLFLSDRREERDLILKISTGAGKTLLGLLYLLSHMEEKEEPGVYLCPTIQLAEQVLEEANQLGVRAEFYPSGEPHPPIEGVGGKSVIVCTYAKLFNARSTFDRTDVLLRPCAIVLDDVHAGIEDIRNRFTLRISSPEPVDELLTLLSDACSHYRPGLWQDLVAGDPALSLEVPFWIWKPLVPEILKKLSNHAEDYSFVFVWPFLRDILRYCRCIVSASAIEIIPDVLPVEMCEAYAEANHRLFTSGTLADDSVLVREVGCDVNAAKKPVVPKRDYGMGERMVLAPSLIDKSLDREYVMELAKTLAKRFNVVALCPSELRARDWEIVGGQIVLGDGVSTAVRELRSPKSKPRLVVFAQRYDGIDLPDSACRVLIIDGMPFGESMVDRYDSSLRSTPGGMRNRIVYRIEQGMGRAVRSHVDYAVVILAGAEIANFIAKKEVLRAMNPDTRAQLQLALELATLAKEDSPNDPKNAVRSMIDQSLKRDEDWKQYYGERVQQPRLSAASPSQMRLEMAKTEREAFQLAIANDPEGGVKLLEDGIDRHTLSEEEKGWYLQKISNYLFEVEPARSLEIQRAAYGRNKSLLCPPKTKVRPLAVVGAVIQETLLKWFTQFDNPNGAIAAIVDLRARLSFEVSPFAMEQALLDLSPLLGVQGSRPEQEYGEGPDNLWLWPAHSLVIEAKNQNKDSLHKEDAAQLGLSLKWFSDNYQTRTAPQPIVVAKTSLIDRKSGFPSNTRVITPEKMSLLLNDVEKFYQVLIQGIPSSLDPKKLAELLPQFGLAPEQFVGRYSVRVKNK